MIEGLESLVTQHISGYYLLVDGVLPVEWVKLLLNL